MADIMKLSGKELEQYLEMFFKKRGYRVRRTLDQGDYGADVILQQGKQKAVVQAKRYNHRVGVKAVQEAIAPKDYYHCDKAMVVTNSYFSRQAEALAKANRVELWDRDALVSRPLASKGATSAESPPATAEMFNEQVAVQPAVIAATTPTCSTCGKPVSAKVHEYCVAHADIFHGFTYCYDHQKEIRSVQKA